MLPPTNLSMIKYKKGNLPPAVAGGLFRWKRKRTDYCLYFTLIDIDEYERNT